MGYKGSPPYVQRIMDRGLRPLKDIVQAYIDDLVAFSPNFQMRLIHLRKLLQLLSKLKGKISPERTFSNYSINVSPKRRLS